MTRLFRLDASIFPTASTTRSLADQVEARFIAAEGEPVDVIRRNVGTDPIPATAWAHSVVAGMIPDAERSTAQREAVALSTTLADELVEADAYLFAVPLYNWGVSQHIKAWVDQVVADSRFSPRTQPIAGRPAILVTARGGTFAPGTPRADWDHATGWYERILRDAWGLDLQTIGVEWTLAGAHDYLAEFRGQAADNLSAGMERADELGTWLASRLPAAMTAGSRA